MQAAAREARLAAGLPVEDEEEAGGDNDGFGLDGAVRLAAPQVSFAENVSLHPPPPHHIVNTAVLVS